MLMFLVNVLRVRYKLNSGIIVQYRALHEKKSLLQERTRKIFQFCVFVSTTLDG